MNRWIIVSVISLLSCSTPVSAQYIGIFMDPSASSCAAAVGTQPWINLYVVFVLEGAAEGTGTQFKITGMPDTWNAQNALWVPDIGIGISLGHPMFPSPLYEDSGGVALAFANCRGPQDQDRIALGRIVLLGAPTPENVLLKVEGAPMTVRQPECPLAFACDAPEFNFFCVGGGEAFLNGDANDVSGCLIVAVEQTTWTAVRVLYR